MMIYRPCPSHPGYSVTATGDVRREPWTKVTKTGREIGQPATIVKHVGRDRAYVTTTMGWVAWRVLVREAWQDDDRPESSYPDGRVITVEEYRAELVK